MDKLDINNTSKSARATVTYPFVNFMSESDNSETDLRTIRRITCITSVHLILSILDGAYYSYSSEVKLAEIFVNCYRLNLK